MISFAIVGCGRIAKRHAQLLSGEIQGARLAAVCDVEDDRAKLLGRQFGVASHTKLDEMLRLHPEIDAVAVLTPSGLHAEHAIQVAHAGKHLVVEKPMALRLQDADAMIRACDQHNVKMFVVKQNRFNRPIRLLRRAIDAGRFGRLILGSVRVRWCRSQSYYDQDSWRGTWALDGGVLANQASHHIDMLEWMMGDVQSVSAKAATALVDIEAEDTAVAILRFESGALGVIEATTATRPKDIEGSISILGESGTAEIAGFAMNEIRTWAFVDQTEEDESAAREYSVNPPDVYGFGHREYYQHVVACLEEGSPALVDGLEGRKSLELISAIYESIETGREVHLRFHPERCRLGFRESGSSGT